MKKYLIVISILVVGVFLYAAFYEINKFDVKEYDITGDFPDTFNGMKLVHFSDILFNTSFDIDKFDKLEESINSLDADFIFFTGDLIDDTAVVSEEEINTITDFLKNINAEFNKYAVIGDNDLKDIDRYKEILDDANFILLDNETDVIFYKDNSPITITGITNFNNNEELDEIYKIDETLTSSYNITLLHHPDIVDLITKGKSDLFLAGHSLGGHVNLPFIGPTIKKDFSSKYIHGSYSVNDTTLIVNNGIGIEDTPFRFMNMPEVNLYRLKKAE